MPKSASETDPWGVRKKNGKARGASSGKWGDTWSCHTQSLPQDPAQASKQSTKLLSLKPPLLSPSGSAPVSWLPAVASPQVNNLACLLPAPG